MTTNYLVGRVQSGGPGSTGRMPLADVPIKVFEATEQTPSLVGSTQTDSEGMFRLPMDRDQSDYIFYAVATVSLQIKLVTVIGPALQYDRPAWTTESPRRAAQGRTEAESDSSL